MLDYAANGVAFWPIEQIISRFRNSVARSGGNPEQVLAEFVGQSDLDAFWRQVEANLRSGRVRMVFVADRIPTELARIVEFLNEQMRPAEVLAIEIEHFVGASGERILLPRLLGATERARSAKAISPPRHDLPEEEWFAELEAKFGSSFPAGRRTDRRMDPFSRRACRDDEQPGFAGGAC